MLRAFWTEEHRRLETKQKGSLGWHGSMGAAALTWKRRGESRRGRKCSPGVKAVPWQGTFRSLLKDDHVGLSQMSD